MMKLIAISIQRICGIHLPRILQGILMLHAANVVKM
jgi:hypothetical protein